jgi:hypothetical protein
VIPPALPPEEKVTVPPEEPAADAEVPAED